MAEKENPFSADQVNDVEVLARALKESGLTEDREKLAKQLLDVAIKKDLALDRTEANSMIARYVCSPDFLLFVASAATLFGNVGYVAQYADKASKSQSGAEQLINIMHTVVFASFALEKMAGIGQSGLSTVAGGSRRDAIKKMVSFMSDNYPLMAGGWHVSNQVASGVVFGLQAGLNGSSNDATTAGTRAMAATAALGMTLYKYHALVKKEEELGVKLVDDRIRRVIEPMDRLLGDKVDALGAAFPYLAAAMLTGPHASIFYNRLTDPQNPKVSVPPVMMMVGYSALVAYMAAKPGDVKPEDAEKQVEEAATQTQQMQKRFVDLAEAFMTRPADTILEADELKNLMVEHMGLDDKAANQVARVAMSALQRKDNAQAILEQLAKQYALQHVEKLQKNMPQHLDTDTKSFLQQQLSALLMEAVQPQLEKLEGLEVNLAEVTLSRREVLFGSWRR